jgi:dipeptidase D
MHEDRVREYVMEVADRNKLAYEIDQAGNIVVKKLPTQGVIGTPGVALQAHLDMVCEKDKGIIHDFSSDPIRLRREKHDWITAKGTTLGADNGIGVAAALAILESEHLEHGPLEGVFTVGEEAGLKGIREISEDIIDSRILLNLDSEEQGVFYIGCAGSRNTELLLETDTEPAPSEYTTFVQLKVGGLSGGHSGLDIDKGRANSIKLLARVLYSTLFDCSARLASFEAGTSPNAIPREAVALACLPSEKISEMEKRVATWETVFRAEYGDIEPLVSVGVEKTKAPLPVRVATPEAQNRWLSLLLSIPHGVLAYDPGVPGLVKTSTNLGIVLMGDGKGRIVTKQRSSLDTELVALGNMVEACGNLAKAEIRCGNEYPPWKAYFDSPTLKVARVVYRKLFSQEPEVKAIHAGLECGVLREKFPAMDMISFGATIRNAHSPNEKVQISSVMRFWTLLNALLKKICDSGG